jgi:hypothetical protein
MTAILPNAKLPEKALLFRLPPPDFRQSYLGWASTPKSTWHGWKGRGRSNAIFSHSDSTPKSLYLNVVCSRLLRLHLAPPVKGQRQLGTEPQVQLHTDEPDLEL